MFHVIGDQDRDGRTEGVQVPDADGQVAYGDQDVQAEGLSNGDFQFHLLILLDELPVLQIFSDMCYLYLCYINMLLSYKFAICTNDICF